MNEEPTESSRSPETARAEEVVDAAGQLISTFASRLWNQMVKNAALAREEVEDMVAEARSMSRDQQG